MYRLQMHSIYEALDAAGVPRSHGIMQLGVAERIGILARERDDLRERAEATGRAVERIAAQVRAVCRSSGPSPCWPSADAPRCGREFFEWVRQTAQRLERKEPSND